MQNTTVVTVSFPKQMAKELDQMAKKEAMTRSEFVRHLLRQDFASKKARITRRKKSRSPNQDQ